MTKSQFRRTHPVPLRYPRLHIDWSIIVLRILHVAIASVMVRTIVIPIAGNNAPEISSHGSHGSPRIHPHRIAGRDRNHRGSGWSVASRGSGGAGGGEAYGLPEPSAPDRAGGHAIFRRLERPVLLAPPVQRRQSV